MFVMKRFVSPSPPLPLSLPSLFYSVNGGDNTSWQWNIHQPGFLRGFAAFVLDDFTNDDLHPASKFRPQTGSVSASVTYSQRVHWVSRYATELLFISVCGHHQHWSSSCVSSLWMQWIYCCAKPVWQIMDEDEFDLLLQSHFNQSWWVFIYL